MLNQQPQPVTHPRHLQREAPQGVDDRTPHGDFVFAHKSGEWMMDVDGDLVPVVVAISRRSGVNGYLADDDPQRDESAWSRVRAEQERRGFIYIDDTALSDDGVETLYAVYPTLRGRLTFRSLVQTPVTSADGVRWEVDQKAWKLICRALVANGTIPKPSAASLRALLAGQDGKLNVLATQRPAAGDPRMDKWTRDYAAAERARTNILGMLAESDRQISHATSAIRSALARFDTSPEIAAVPTQDPTPAPAQEVREAQQTLAPTPARRRPGLKPKAQLDSIAESREAVDLGDE